MRTLFEIIEAVKNNEAVTDDEMRYSICVMDALMIFDRESLMTLVEGEEKGKNKFIYSPKFQLNERFERIKCALDKNPKDWLGDAYFLERVKKYVYDTHSKEEADEIVRYIQ